MTDLLHFIDGTRSRSRSSSYRRMVVLLLIRVHITKGNPHGPCIPYWAGPCARLNSLYWPPDHRIRYDLRFLHHSTENIHKVVIRKVIHWSDVHVKLCYLVCTDSPTAAQKRTFGQVNRKAQCAITVGLMNSSTTRRFGTTHVFFYAQLCSLTNLECNLNLNLFVVRDTWTAAVALATNVALAPPVVHFVLLFPPRLRI